MPWGTGTIGQVIAVIVLVLVIVLCVIGKLPILLGGLFAALAVARLT